MIVKTLALPLLATLLALSLLVQDAAASTGWMAGPPAPGGMVARFGHAMAYDAARDRVVLFGGYGGGVLGDTWEYDGAGWTAGGGGSIAPRAFHCMAYDAARGVTVLFGGSDGPGSFLGDTWEYDGATWTAAATSPTSPAAREFAAMAFDSGRSVVIMFGGDDGAALRSDTWEYDGSSWALGATAPSGLSPRNAHTMAYDDTRAAVVLFGGSFGGAFDFSDTWFYDGSTWSAGPPPSLGLAPRSGHTLVFDPGRGRSVMFGGSTGGTNVAETWELGSGGWSTGAAPPVALAPRALQSMAFDTRRGRTVMFGGSDGVSDFADTWELVDNEIGLVVGQGLGAPNPNRVRGYAASGKSSGVDFLAFAAGSWGVNVSRGDIDATSLAEILAGPGPGDVYGPQCRAFQASGAPLSKVNYFAYGTLKYGLNVDGTSIDGDGFDEILTGPGPGVVFGPHVRGFDFDGAALTTIAKVSFYAYGTLKYGANVAGGRVDGDGFGEIATGPGPGPFFAPQVRGFDYDAVAVSAIAALNFFAFAGAQYGVNIASGDVDGDTLAEIAATPGPGPTSSFPARFLGFDFDGSAVAGLRGFDVIAFPATSYGGRIGLADVSPDGRADLLAGAGRDPSAASTVKAYAYDGTALTQLAGSFTPFAGGYGVNVAGGRFGY